jgi:hypothetical protein
MLEKRGIVVRFPVGIKVYLFSKPSTLKIGRTHFAVQWATGALSLLLKRQGPEADYSPQSRAEAKNEWKYTSIALYAFMVRQGTTLSLLNISHSVCDYENNQIILCYSNVLKQEKVESSAVLGMIYRRAVVSGNKWKCAEKSVVFVDFNHDILLYFLQLFPLQITLYYFEVNVHFSKIIKTILLLKCL